MFKIPIALTLAILVAVLIFAGPKAAAIVSILAVLEVSLSFDNAVVNAKILGKMNPYWQKIFLTVGIAIAVFGMRLIFPLAVVAIAATLSPLAVVDLAIKHPFEYAHQLHLAHPAIAAFGGIFLLMIFLDFLLEEREITWLGPIERIMARVGKLDYLSIIVSLIVLGVTALTFAKGHADQVLIAGVFGLATYLGTNSLAALFETDETDAIKTVATGGFFTFLYLEVLDASFSFDGVTGAFAVSDNIFVIALGLGIGALFIRSLTVYLVRKGTLSDYVYLEHGAHYAIGALALLLFAGIAVDVPELITGLIGVGFIGTAFAHSLIRLRGANDKAEAGRDLRRA